MDLVRFQRLTKLDSIARQQTEDQAYLVKQDEGTVKLDQAAVDTAKLNLSYCLITSPVAGRVGLRPRRSGQLTSPDHRAPELPSSRRSSRQRSSSRLPRTICRKWSSGSVRPA